MALSPEPSTHAHILVGPTAVGKSAVAQWIAERRGRPILSADALLVYRGMDVGTAKPSAGERARARYYGLDLVGASDTFNVAGWLVEARRAFTMEPAGSLMVAGGTGLYVRCLVEGLAAGPAPDPAARARWQALHMAEGVAGLQAALRARAPDALAALADPQNPRRLIRALERADTAADPAPAPWLASPAHAPIVGLRLSPAEHHAAIARRVAHMYHHGFVAEVERLLQDPVPLSETARKGIGYAEAIALLEGRSTRDDAMARTVTRTRQYAKRQRTWFERQANVSWIDVQVGQSVEAIAAEVEARWRELGPTTVTGMQA